MNIKTFYCNPYRECTYIVEMHDGASKQCLIIDPGMYSDKEEQRVFDYIAQQGLTPVAILITHHHPDHICGLESVQRRFPNLPIIDNAQCTMHGKAVDDAQCTMQVIPTPGHKEDAVCFYFENEKVLFSGDTLFQENVGRTDLPGGDMKTLIRSLETLKELPEDTQVYPGHGNTTTIGHEKQYNPYF
ncbi:MAG: MBL fold metallo-hydrolase [Paludibacteraceae bacterium]|nr:MBL fold metallo-hydrolase [Paludibacteraceae bacterium]